jgi:hypothetical protein
MLARINVAGAQPTTRDGWLLVWAAIYQTCTPSAPAAHAKKPGRHPLPL